MKAKLYIDSAGNLGFWHLVEYSYHATQHPKYPGRRVIDKGKCHLFIQHTDANSAIDTCYDTSLLSAVLGVDVTDGNAYCFDVEDSDKFISDFREAEKQLIRSFSL